MLQGPDAGCGAAVVPPPSVHYPLPAMMRDAHRKIGSLRRPLAALALAALLTTPTAAQEVREGTPEPALPQILELDLRRALEIAVAADLGLQIEDLSTQIARFNSAASWGAFDPVLTASGSVSDSEFEGQSILSGGDVLEENTLSFDSSVVFPLLTGGSIDVSFRTDNTKTNNTFQLINPATTDSVSITYQQPLLRGAWREYATSTQREADLEYRSQVEVFRLRRQELLQVVADAYWNVVSAEEQLGVAESMIELAREQLDQNQRRLDAGVGTDVEVLQAEANEALRVEQRLMAEVAVRDAFDALRAVLFPGTREETWELEIRLVTPLPEQVDDPVPSWQQGLARALERRPELLQQALRIEASEVQLARARSEKRHGLDLSLTASSRGFDGNSADAFGEAIGFDYPSTTAALSYSVPFRNRAARNAERAARASVRVARLTFDQIETQVVAEVRSAVRQVLYQAQAVQAAGTSLDLARRQLEAEEARLRVGLSTTFQVLEFQQDYSEALSTERSARASYAKARVALLRAQGIIGELQP